VDFGENEQSGPSLRDAKMARLEAILFLAKEPLSSRKLSQAANLADGTEARTLVRRLNKIYDVGHTAFRVEEVAGGFQLLTRFQYGRWLRRLHGAQVETRLSAPALETLAVVAYRQPVPRAEVENIRGVQCGEMLRQLMERDLVRIVGRGEELGRPFLYGTTRRFLQILGLRDLEELPRRGQLLNPPPVNPEGDNNVDATQFVSEASEMGEESKVLTTTSEETMASDAQSERLQATSIQDTAPRADQDEDEYEYYEEYEDEDEEEDDEDGEWEYEDEEEDDDAEEDGEDADDADVEDDDAEEDDEEEEWEEEDGDEEEWEEVDDEDEEDWEEEDEDEEEDAEESDDDWEWVDDDEDEDEEEYEDEEE
jgi:segregation and condensation protein B